MASGARDGEEARREIARLFRTDLWNRGDLDLADRLVAPGCHIHARLPLATDFATGPEAVRQLVLFYRLAFSDLEMRIEELVVEGDMTVARWRGEGTHTGDLLGMPPTHRRITTDGIDMLRIEGGRIVEGWVAWDALSLLEQLLALAEGVQPPDPGAGFLQLLSRFRPPG